MAGESMVDEAYYVEKIMFNSGGLTDRKINMWRRQGSDLI